MRIPVKPPDPHTLLEHVTSADPKHLRRVIDAAKDGTPGGKYLHWDQLRHRKPPAGLTAEEWWWAVKFARAQNLRDLPLLDIQGEAFRFGMPDMVQQMVHRIDRDASGRIGVSEQVTNPDTRDRYLMSSLIEEAITSSQLEGASTTSPVAKDMLLTGRKPSDRSEQMILNNFMAIRRTGELKDDDLTPDHVLELHRILAEGALDDPGAAGRFRLADEQIHVVDRSDGTILHTPPPAKQLERRLDLMCEFANGAGSRGFIHPVLRAVILHFWLAYDHPFVDGNGRAARALFYWSMLREGYWLCEYLSISRILRKAPAQYGQSFLYTETDANDLTYFIIYQLEVVTRAIDALDEYLQRKIQQVRQLELLLRRSKEFNHRQVALLGHALRHPGFRYMIKPHQRSHNIVYETARSDLLNLVEQDLLQKSRVGNAYVFLVPRDLESKLRE